MKKILFVASECVPFIKTGGLADVCGALPKEFDKNYWDVRVVIPDYSCIPEQYRNNFEYVTHFYMSSGPYVQDKYVGVLKYEQDGITYYFIDNQEITVHQRIVDLEIPILLYLMNTKHTFPRLCLLHQLIVFTFRSYDRIIFYGFSFMPSPGISIGDCSGKTECE